MPAILIAPPQLPSWVREPLTVSFSIVRPVAMQKQAQSMLYADSGHPTGKDEHHIKKADPLSPMGKTVNPFVVRATLSPIIRDEEKKKRIGRNNQNNQQQPEPNVEFTDMLKH